MVQRCYGNSPSPDLKRAAARFSPLTHFGVVLMPTIILVLVAVLNVKYGEMADAARDIGAGSAGIERGNFNPIFKEENSLGGESEGLPFFKSLLYHQISAKDKPQHTS